MLTRHFSFLLCFAATANTAALGDVILDWNHTATEMLVADIISQHPGEASRNMAMTNLAMYDAVQLAAPGGSPYYQYTGEFTVPAGDISRDAAAAQAAYSVLTAAYPALEPELAVKLATTLDVIPAGAAKTSGVELGTSIAASIVARRAGDGYDANVQYMPSGEAGHWEPDPLNPAQEAWGPVWGQVQPFSLQSGQQFTAPPMPELTSQEYADAFNEVRVLGAVDSMSRTAEQTEIALFWAYDRIGLGTPMTRL